MLFGTSKEIIKKIKEVELLLKDEKINDVRVAMCNYLGNLYSALEVIKGENIKVSKRKIFGNLDNYQMFIKKSDYINTRFYDNIVFYQDFHQDLFYEVLKGIENIFSSTVCGREYCDDSDIFTVDDFWEILKDFLKKLNLEDIYNELVNDKRIFKMTKGDDYNNFLGLNLHNPITGESNILIDDFKYDLSSLFILVHEIGHYYDLEEFNSRDKINNYIDFIYKSHYQEVISLLFEKLFLTYLLENNIKKECTIDLLIDNKIINHSRLYSAYIFSLLDEGYITKGQFKNISYDKLLFSIKDKIEEVDTELLGLDLCDDFIYTYGDYISLFLKDEIEKEGFNGRLMKSFNEIRYLEFNPDFITEFGLLPKTYKKLYCQELDKFIK